MHWRVMERLAVVRPLNCLVLASASYSMSALLLPRRLKRIPVLARAAHGRKSEDRWGRRGNDAVVDINDEGSSLTALHDGSN